jgi:hypothetical protein
MRNATVTSALFASVILAALPASAQHLFIGTDRNTSRVLVPSMIEQFTQSPGQVDSVAFSPDGARAFFGSFFNGEVHVQDMSSPFSPTRLTNGGVVTSVCADPDNLRVWVANGGFALQEVRVSPFAVTPHSFNNVILMALTASPDGRELFGATLDGRLVAIDKTTFAVTTLAAIPANGTYRLAVDPSGRFLLATSAAPTGHRLTRVRLADRTSQTITLPGEPSGLALAGDGRAWMSFLNLGQVGHTLYAVTSLPAIVPLNAVAPRPSGLALSSDERYLFVIHESRDVTRVELPQRSAVIFPGTLSATLSGTQAWSAAAQPDLGSRRWTTLFSNAAGATALDRSLPLAFSDVTGDGLADACARDASGVVCAAGIPSPNGDTFDTTLRTWSPQFGAQIAADETRWRTLRFVDVSGDRRADVCAREADGVRCGVSNGVNFNFNANPVWTARFNGVNGAGASASPSVWRTLQFPSLNNDSRVDLCGRDVQGVVCGTSDGVGAFANVATWSAFFSDASDARWRTDESWWSTIRFGDVTGDGRDDVCARRSDGYWCGVNNGNGGFNAPTRWETSLTDVNGWNQPQYYRTIQLADVDGDSRADVCFRGIAGVYCARSNGTSAFVSSAMQAPIATSFSDANGWSAERYYRTIRVVDVTGDGLADVCGRGFDGIFCAYSRSTAQGASFLPAELRVRQFGDLYGWNASESHWGTVQPVSLDVTRGAEWCGRGDQGLWCSNR